MNKKDLSEQELLFLGYRLIKFFKKNGTTHYSSHLKQYLKIEKTDRRQLNKVFDFLQKNKIILWDKNNPVIKTIEAQNGRRIVRKIRNISILDYDESFFELTKIINNFRRNKNLPMNKKTKILMSFCSDFPEKANDIPTIFGMKKTSWHKYKKELKLMGFKFLRQHKFKQKKQDSKLENRVEKLESMIKGFGELLTSVATSVEKMQPRKESRQVFLHKKEMSIEEYAKMMDERDGKTKDDAEEIPAVGKYEEVDEEEWEAYLKKQYGQMGLINKKP